MLYCNLTQQKLHKGTDVSQFVSNTFAEIYIIKFKKTSKLAHVVRQKIIKYYYLVLLIFSSVHTRNLVL